VLFFCVLFTARVPPIVKDNVPPAGNSPVTGTEDVNDVICMWFSREIIVREAGSVRVYDPRGEPYIVNLAVEKMLPKGLTPPVAYLAPDGLIVIVPESPAPPINFPKSRVCVWVKERAKMVGDIHRIIVKGIMTFKT